MIEIQDDNFTISLDLVSMYSFTPEEIFNLCKTILSTVEIRFRNNSRDENQIPRILLVVLLEQTRIISHGYTFICSNIFHVKHQTR